jgi:hypothetical protein
LKRLTLHDHGPEIIGGLLLLVISAILPFIGISNDVAWFAGIMSVLLPLSVTSTKHYFTTVVQDVKQKYLATEGRAAQVGTILGQLNGPQLEHATKVVDSTIEKLEKIQKGRIQLSVSDYYHEIIEAMKNAPSGTQVHALNIIDELRWKDDPQQRNYLVENLSALRRGVTINRIFIINRKIFFSSDPQNRIEILRDQSAQERLKLWIVWKEALRGHESMLRDCVAFDKPSVVLYTDYPDPIDHTRVSHGEMVVNKIEIDTYLSDFSILCEAAVTVDAFIEEVESELKTGVHTSRSVESLL